MKRCVYTAIYGGYDQLLPVRPEWRKGWDLIAFTDDPDLNRPGWTVRVLENDEGCPQRMARKIKIRFFDYLPGYAESLWVDGNVDVRGDLNQFSGEHFSGRRFVARKHKDRLCLFDEVDACLRMRKAPPGRLAEQARRYRDEGFPSRNGLFDTCTLFRVHDDQNRELCAAWWAELRRTTNRDQISLPYVLWDGGWSVDHVDHFTACQVLFRKKKHARGRVVQEAGAAPPDLVEDAAGEVEVQSRVQEVGLPKIDVRIPFEPGGKLGEDYNRIMAETPHEWVLFLDHDVLILHPSWYHVAQQCIAAHGRTAGILTCWTNNIGCAMQLHPAAPHRDAPVLEHKAFARRLWNEHGYGCTCIDKSIISGFFILTSKTAWQAAGGFPGQGFFAEDTHYHRRMKKAGLRCLRMDGVYAYHLRDRNDTPWIEGVPVSNSMPRRAGPKTRRTRG